MKSSILFIAPFVTLSLFAADAGYTAQHGSADKAFSELEGKENTDKDLQLQKKELEIERLKLELERQKLAEEKQKMQQPTPKAETAPQKSSYSSAAAGVFIGIEAYSASGTRTHKLTTSSGQTSEYEHDIDYSQQTLKLGIGGVGEDRLALGITSGKDITYEGYSLYKKGTSIDICWDIVMSSLYKPSSQENLLPFIRLGFGAGNYEYLDEEKALYSDDSATTVELKLGVGVYFQFNKSFELAASYDVQTAMLAYQNASGDKWNITDSVGGIAVGLNIHF